MGTTTTPNLGLIKPDLDESMTNWVTQWATTADLIDAASYTALGTYTPVWTASTTNPTIGVSGSITGKWIRLGPSLVITYIQIFNGSSGFNAGSGSYRFSLPFGVTINGIQSGTTGRGPCPGKAYARNSSTGTRMTGVPQIRSVTAEHVIVVGESPYQIWSSSSPFVWDNFDAISMYVVYTTSEAP